VAKPVDVLCRHHAHAAAAYRPTGMAGRAAVDQRQAARISFPLRLITTGPHLVLPPWTAPPVDPSPSPATRRVVNDLWISAVHILRILLHITGNSQVNSCVYLCDV
jgi:hypothetical protein